MIGAAFWAWYYKLTPRSLRFVIMGIAVVVILMTPMYLEFLTTTFSPPADGPNRMPAPNSSNFCSYGGRYGFPGWGFSSFGPNCLRPSKPSWSFSPSALSPWRFIRLADAPIIPTKSGASFMVRGG